MVTGVSLAVSMDEARACPADIWKWGTGRGEWTVETLESHLETPLSLHYSRASAPQSSFPEIHLAFLKLSSPPLVVFSFRSVLRQGLAM